MTLGVVVVHRPGSPAGVLPAVEGLVGQVDELLVVHNGHSTAEDSGDGRFHAIGFAANRGTAAAWNAALSRAVDHGHRYLYLLDQDSSPSPDAVAVAQRELAASGAAAAVQPARRDRLGLDPFPWNTVASGSLFDVGALQRAGGFDERLFVDEVDHEVLARLRSAGHGVRPLARATIDHVVGSPRPVRLLGRRAVASGHDDGRRRLQGYSTGVLVRRYATSAPATALRRALRLALTAAKDQAASEPAAARALVAGFVSGLATAHPPARAAERPCPYCGGPLLGRFAAVPNWRYGAGAPADVYRCATCGALAAGRVPAAEEIASWYAGYYTHAAQPAPGRPWARLWPTPVRRAEIDRLNRFLAPAGERGRVLEVGAGSGERLARLLDAGWEVVGQDPDPEAGQVARERGIAVHRCPVADLVGREEPFDLIGLNHVLEHVADPAALLRACAALLRPGGRICVVSPNAGSLGRLVFGRWWFGLEQPRHLAIPTLASLDRVASAVGLLSTSAETVATNGAVILGGSLARLGGRLRPAPLRGGVSAVAALVGQATGRAALALHASLGEEVVWVGRRDDRGPGQATSPLANASR